MRLALVGAGDCMSRLINPLLLDPASGNGSLLSRNFARATAAQPAEGASFAKELAAAQTPPKPLGVEGPLQLTPSEKPAAASQSAVSGAVEGSASEVDEAVQPVEPASSWRVDRSAAEVSFEDGEFGFDDLIDIINPLHHIPILGSVYRQLTGDEIKPVSNIVGGVLFGAATGSVVVSTVSGVLSAAYEQNSGSDPLMQVAALLGFGPDEPDSATMMAQAEQLPMKPDVSPTLASAQPAPAATDVFTPTPVKVAQASPVVPDAAAKASVAAKAPYGGVIDMAGAARNTTQAAALADAAQVKGMAMGDKIYTNPRLSKSVHAAELQAAKATASLSPDAVISVPGTTSKDGKNLGQMMMTSADAKASGNQLPPELVRDMMLMALDKYKTAGNLAPSEMTVSGVN